MLKKLCSLCLCLLALSACQHTPSSDVVRPIIHTSAAKGEWSLQQLSEQHVLQLDSMRYRISLRISRQEFSLAAPCARLLGQYRSNTDILHFSQIEKRDIVCAQNQDAKLLQQLLQNTAYYRIEEDLMHWYDAQHQHLATWQRIYL